MESSHRAETLADALRADADLVSGLDERVRAAATLLEGGARAAAKRGLYQFTLNVSSEPGNHYRSVAGVTLAAERLGLKLKVWAFSSADPKTRVDQLYESDSYELEIRVRW